MRNLLASVAVVVLSGTIASPHCFAQSAEPEAAAPETNASQTASDAGGLGSLVTAIVLRVAPHDYENTKQWGGTKRVWDGLHIQSRGLRITTKRRWKEANHGTWKKYRVWLIDPERRFEVQFRNLAATEEGAEFDLIVNAELGAFGRISEWRRDLQLFSFSANARAKVHLRLRCEMSASLDTSRFPPDVLLDLEARDADLQLIDFDLLRISDADGPVVHQLGEAIERVLESELRDRRGKLTRQINEEIDEHQDELRLSTTDLAKSGWSEVLQLLQLAE